MDYKQEYLTKRIKEINENLLDPIKEGCENREKVEAVLNMNEKFSLIIKDFFSDTDGEGETIRKVYSEVRNNGFKLPKITIQNCNLAHNKYSEYTVGMKMFITSKLREINAIDNEEECTKLEEFMEKDANFISSLFGDGSNSEIVKDVPLQDALENLEVLIDFLPFMKRAADYAIDLNKEITDSGNSDNVLACTLLKMYACSTINFSSKLIVSIFESFQSIVDAMNRKKFVLPSRTPSEIPEFRVF